MVSFYPCTLHSHQKENRIFLPILSSHSRGTLIYDFLTRATGHPNLSFPIAVEVVAAAAEELEPGLVVEPGNMLPSWLLDHMVEQQG